MLRGAGGIHSGLSSVPHPPVKKFPELHKDTGRANPRNLPSADLLSNGVHGLNERVEVKAVYVGRDFMYDLVKAYADKP